MKSVLSAVALASLVPLSGCVVVNSQGHISREEKRFTVGAAPDLRLTTFDGAIEIRSGDARTVIVEIEKRGPTQEAIDQLKVETRQDGNRIDVEVKRLARDVVFLGIDHITPTARLIVTMPRDGNVVAKSGDGAIRIDHVRGRLELHTGDGSIRATDVGGQLALSTGDGSVTLDGVDGDLDVDAGDGSVSVAGKLGIVRQHTRDGSVTFRADAGTSMKDDGPSPRVIAAPGMICNLRPSPWGEVSRRAMRGRLGAGGKMLRIRTGDGSVRLNAS